VYCTQVAPENEEIGVMFMMRAANAGDRSAMIYLAKAYESGNGLGINRSVYDSTFWSSEASCSCFKVEKLHSRGSFKT